MSESETIQNEQVESTETKQETEKTPDQKVEATPKKDESEYLPDDFLTKYKIKQKINGKEHELPLAEALKTSGLHRAAYEKMEEAAKIRKEAEELKSKLKANPRAFLKEFGIDTLKLGEEELEEYVNESRMTDEQKELKRLKALEAQIKKQKEDEEQSKQAESLKQLEAEQAQKVQQDIMEVVKLVNLGPDTNVRSKKMVLSTAASIMRDASLKQLDLTPHEIADIINEKLDDYVTDFVSARGITDFVDKLPKQMQQTLKEHFIKMASQSAPTPKTEPAKRAAVTLDGQSEQRKPIFRSLAEHTAWYEKHGRA